MAASRRSARSGCSANSTSVRRLGAGRCFVWQSRVIKPAGKHTGTMPRRRRSWPSTLVRRLLFDVVTLAGIAVTSRSQLAAENLFLRKQLALYQERRLKPRRPDPAMRVVLVLLSRLLDWRAPDGGSARHAHPVASSGLAAPLAVEVAARTAAHSEGVAATH